MDQWRANEKRDFMRMPMDAEIHFKEKGAERMSRGTGVDLSHNGLQFTTDTPLRVGVELDVIIRVGGEKFQPLIASFKVLRVDPNENSTYLIAGALETVK